MDEEVIIEVLDPEAELHKKLSVTPVDAIFSTSLVVEGEHAINGTYTAKATHGKQSATSTFVMPEFPVSIIIFATAVSLIFVTRLLQRSR